MKGTEPEINQHTKLIMNESTATPLPEPNLNAGTNPPGLNVVPEPTPEPHRSQVNKEVAEALTYATDVCTAAKLPEFAAGLLKRGITGVFVTTLEEDIALASGMTATAVDCDSSRQGATLAEGDAEKKLLENLQVIQAAARTEFLPEHPAKLGSYLIGEALNDSRAALDENAKVLITRASQERPALLDTAFIVATEDSRKAFMKEEGNQSTHGGKGKGSRREREELVKNITGRRKKIQYAADTLWPHGKASSTEARVKFRLPENRPYSY